MARYTGQRLPALPARRPEALPQGRALLHGQVRLRAPPVSAGQHGQGRVKLSDYGVQLREKQKVKRIYGLLERQFRGYYHRALARRRASRVRTCSQLLERRLDNVVFRMGFAATRAEARQLVRHGHFTVNGKRVNIPSYLVQAGRRRRGAEKSRRRCSRINEALDAVDRRGVPQWIELDKKNFNGTVEDAAVREDLTHADPASSSSSSSTRSNRSQAVARSAGARGASASGAVLSRRPSCA